MTSFVTVRRCAMVFYKWGGNTIWLPYDDVEHLIALNAAKPKERRGIAYVVRCCPRGATPHRQLGKGWRACR